MNLYQKYFDINMIPLLLLLVPLVSAGPGPSIACLPQPTQSFNLTMFQSQNTKLFNDTCPIDLPIGGYSFEYKNFINSGNLYYLLSNIPNNIYITGSFNKSLALQFCVTEP